jgi:hypothetical protein
MRGEPSHTASPLVVISSSFNQVGKREPFPPCLYVLPSLISCMFFSVIMYYNAILITLQCVMPFINVNRISTT